MPFLGLATATAWLLGIWLTLSAFRHPGIIRTPRTLVSAAGFAMLGTLLGSALILLHFFQTFSGETLVARVTARRLSPLEVELTYTPVRPGPSKQPAWVDDGQAARRIRLAGDQWFLSGGIVKWHPWLTALGLKSYHRPMRLGGQFSDLKQQRAHRPTVYALEPVADRLWEALYWADRHLPFVEAVYGSSAYVYVEPGVTQEVYVTPSGYLIKRASERVSN